MGVPRTPFLAVIAIPAILSTASFLLLFYAVWVEQFAFRLYNKLYIRKCFRAGIVDDCLALYRVRLPWVCAAAGQWGRCEERGRRQRMRKRTKNSRGLSKYVPSALLFLLFEAVAVTLWLTKGNLFYLLNFSYIGACLGLGTALFTAGKRYARHFVQLAVGSYMLLYLGVISHENMQIEGFWYYLFLGVFEAATIHYAVAKIFGPLLFGRGWCGYACWTAMVLDFLPYKQPQKPRKKRLGILRYVMFALSLALVSGLFLMKVAHLEEIMFWLFLAGNALYYIAGIALAFLFRDNRAFCKYLCPITVFLKPMSYFSLLRVHCDEEKCIHCGKCLRTCPMDVEVNRESRKRKNGTECILCYECTKACPTKALH